MSATAKYALPSLKEVKELLGQTVSPESFSRVDLQRYRVRVDFPLGCHLSGSEVRGIICSAMIEKFGIDSVYEKVDVLQERPAGSSGRASDIKFPTVEIISLVAQEYGLGSVAMCDWLAYNYGVTVQPGVTLSVRRPTLK